MTKQILNRSAEWECSLILLQTIDELAIKGIKGRGRF